MEGPIHARQPLEVAVMLKRRSDLRLFVLVLVLGAFASSSAADAASLEDVAGAVKEATAPIQETVEQVVPPANPPAPVAPPAAQPPEVKVPKLPVKPPAVNVP